LLGDFHAVQFGLQGQPEDINKAIKYKSLALSLTPDTHPDLPHWMGILGVFHVIRFQGAGVLEDLEKAIEYISRALAWMPQDDPWLPQLLDLLGGAYSLRCECLGDLHDVEKLIEVRSRVVRLTPNGGPKLSDRLDSLAASHKDRFNHLGDLSDLKKAIEGTSHALALTPDGHPELPTLLITLGASHMCRFEHLGGLSDLEKAIECTSHALTLTLDGHPHLPGLLINLGVSHMHRFEHLGDLSDLEKAIECHDFASDFASILGVLWYDIVKLVLNFLGCLNAVPTEDLPHVTWCPTGALSFLPLHAASNYNQPGSKVFDYVISSYTPTVAALLASTTMAQPNTPGHSRLPRTTKELVYVKSHTQGKAEYMELVGDQATKTAVLDAMQQNDWVHLACHAHQNVHNPTESRFFLHDDALDLTSINQQSFKNKGLVYLLACQTAKGNKKLPDEALHLASGMLMAGYLSVIATMWSVVDEDTPLVADIVYGQLMKDGKLGSGEAGKALHNVVTALCGKVGEQEFHRWVPYIHIGS
ncbi:hypothetical protein FRC11_010953, partial [Ceratobasidium sp. 423]